MGIKGSPALFQQAMSEALAGLLYNILELYLDDIIVHGEDADSYISNLETVFARLRERGLTLNPEKCKFGLEQVEYVGHLIDKEGLSMSAEKRNKVTEFPKPKKFKEMKSFLGLANYFRDHVRNHSMSVKPLHDMLVDYNNNKNKVLRWTPEAENAFEEIKRAIDSCQTIFFLNPTDPVFLQTDASDYGVGAYLFQMVDGVERPAAFLSKSLSGAELNWTTQEKEAYAIFWSFIELNYLIRDRFFTLQTDHDNLKYINTHPSQKVMRWKLAIAEYDCIVEHIPGVDNIVADSLSRLMMADVPTTTLGALEEIPYGIKAFLQDCHNDIVGHGGVQRTRGKILKLCPNANSDQQLTRHVRQYIRGCACCQKMSQLKPVIKTYPYTTSSRTPMDTVSVDTLGPFPEDEDGNKYIVVIIDCFSKFVELQATKDLTALGAAQCLFRYVGRYGTPSRLVSDNGTQYVNDVIMQLTRYLGLHHHKITPYSHEENSIVERANKEVLRHLMNLVFDKNTIHDWSLNLPLVQRILNAEIHLSTGVSPAQIVFGNAIDLDRMILNPPPAAPEVSDRTRTRSYRSAPCQAPGEPAISSWMDKMLKNQALLIKLAQDDLDARDYKHITANRLTGPLLGSSEFPVGSYVLVSPPEGKGSKLASPWQGPYRVIQQSPNADQLTIQNLVNHRDRKVHVKHVKPFLYNPNETDPKSVALKDYQEFEIEKIINHNGDPSDRTAMSFLVRWTGYSEADDVWVDWKELKNTDQLHLYLSKHNMKRLLPRSYQPTGTVRDAGKVK
jgi:hypothetical protein